MSGSMDELQRSAERALALLDLTNLDESCTEAAIDALCARAATPHGTVAALCVWPEFVARARLQRPQPDIRIATVANFPRGTSDVEGARRGTAEAFAAGADEVDVVLPWRALLDGDRATPVALVRHCRSEVPSTGYLKVILETGELERSENILEASHLALDNGAHFIKTSTGKVAVNATLAAVRLMLEAIKTCGRQAGIKPAGGIRTLVEAKAYLDLAGEVMGESWVRPETFRFGASSLLDDLVATIEGSKSVVPPVGY
jgi:deoxyribose-phosphate aldolase